MSIGLEIPDALRIMAFVLIEKSGSCEKTRPVWRNEDLRVSLDRRVCGEGGWIIKCLKCQNTEFDCDSIEI